MNKIVKKVLKSPELREKAINVHINNIPYLFHLIIYKKVRPSIEKYDFYGELKFKPGQNEKFNTKKYSFV